MHGVRIDRIHKLIEQRIGGTVDEAEIAAAGAEARRAVRSLGGGPGGHVSLYDLSAIVTISDAAIASALRQRADPRYSCVRARKVALVAPSALARLKLAGPVQSRANLCLFADRGSAMRWLFACSDANPVGG